MFYFQGKTNPVGQVECPISGDFAGMLPDEPGYCAQVYLLVVKYYLQTCLTIP